MRASKPGQKAPEQPKVPRSRGTHGKPPRAPGKPAGRFREVLHRGSAALGPRGARSRAAPSTTKPGRRVDDVRVPPAATVDAPAGPAVARARRGRDTAAETPEEHRGEGDLAAFRPEPAILTAPGTTAAAGSGPARAEAAALADRLLASLRVGRRADGSHEVRLELSRGSRYDDLSVRLHQDGDALVAVIQTPPGAARRGRELARAIERELAALRRGATSVRVEDA